MKNCTEALYYIKEYWYWYNYTSLYFNVIKSQYQYYRKTIDAVCGTCQFFKFWNEKCMSFPVLFVIFVVDFMSLLISLQTMELYTAPSANNNAGKYVKHKKNM